MWGWERWVGGGATELGGLGPGQAIGRGLLPGGLNLFSEIGILGRVGEMGAETAVGQGAGLTVQGPQARAVCSAFSTGRTRTLDHPWAKLLCLSYHTFCYKDFLSWEDLSCNHVQGSSMEGLDPFCATAPCGSLFNC